MSHDFDLIVAGAGSGGCVVAARVSENPRVRILLIESGPDYPNVDSLPEDLRNVNHASFNDHDWGLTHTPSTTSRSVPFARGRVVGGSSAVNTAIALRGVPDDYDEWARLGNDPAQLPFMGFTRHVVIAASDREALGIARRAYARWFASFIKLWREARNEPAFW